MTDGNVTDLLTMNKIATRIPFDPAVPSPLEGSMSPNFLPRPQEYKQLGCGEETTMSGRTAYSTASIPDYVNRSAG